VVENNVHDTVKATYFNVYLHV
jgi:hypothetical protein